jgi:hypothetical protein
MRDPPHHFGSISFALLAGLLGQPSGAQNHAQPSIEFTLVPPEGPGGPLRFGAIEGRVKGALPGERIVLFAQSDEFWWVQPLADQPFTEIHPDSRWKSTTHPGSAYAALLVDSRYLPPAKVHELPKKGGLVLAVAFIKGGAVVSSEPMAPARDRGQPWIEFTVVPPAGPGNSVMIQTIEGRVSGAGPGERIVLYARSGVWWVQPSTTQPFTDIQADSRWKGTTHPGEAFAALLVDSRYSPAPKVVELPEKGGSVLAVATANGTPSPPSPVARTIQFSGYPWKIRASPGDGGGTLNYYDPANAWTDQRGFLHLRIAKRGDTWKCAEATLTRSLGYGSYRFVVSDVSHLEPAAVFIIGPAGKMDIEFSRWGRREDKNAQYVLKPFNIPGNMAHFTTPAGALTQWMDWQPGRVTFRTVRGSLLKAGPGIVAEHVFASGVAAPGQEGVSLNLYVFGNTQYPLKHEFEVVIEKFEFFP